MLERYNNLLSGKKYESIKEFTDSMLNLLFKFKDIYYYILTNDINSIKDYSKKLVIPYILLFMVCDNKILKIIFDKIKNNIFIIDHNNNINYNDIQEYKNNKNNKNNNIIIIKFPVLFKLHTRAIIL
jgi:hypothetical protein